MEAPTPVSALLHAATLVTAGIYLLLRSSPILEYSPTALLILTFIGSTTAFVAATSGLVQNDLKRIVAFSTISQLGYTQHTYTLLLVFLDLFLFLIIDFSGIQLFNIIFLLFISILASFPLRGASFYQKNFIISLLVLLQQQETTPALDLLKNRQPIQSKDRFQKFVSIVPLKILGLRSYSTKVSSLDPWFITGFSDAESSFSFSVSPRPASTLG